MSIPGSVLDGSLAHLEGCVVGVRIGRKVGRKVGKRLVEDW